MVTTELTDNAVIASDASQRPARDRSRQVLALWGALWAVTAIAALLAVLWPGLAPAGRPHPSLHPTIGAITSILWANIAVLFAPFALIALRFQDGGRLTRLCGDGLLLLVLGRSASTVGCAIGHDGTRLLPYIPQLPVEYAAAALAGGVWLAARADGPPVGWRCAARYALLTLLLLTIAAVIEVLATPHLPR